MKDVLIIVIALLIGYGVRVFYEKRRDEHADR